MDELRVEPGPLRSPVEGHVLREGQEVGQGLAREGPRPEEAHRCECQERKVINRPDPQASPHVEADQETIVRFILKYNRSNQVTGQYEKEIDPARAEVEP